MNCCIAMCFLDNRCVIFSRWGRGGWGFERWWRGGDGGRDSGAPGSRARAGGSRPPPLHPAEHAGGGRVAVAGASERDARRAACLRLRLLRRGGPQVWIEHADQPGVAAGLDRRPPRRLPAPPRGAKRRRRGGKRTRGGRRVAPSGNQRRGGPGSRWRIGSERRVGSGVGWGHDLWGGGRRGVVVAVAVAVPSRRHTPRQVGGARSRNVARHGAARKRGDDDGSGGANGRAALTGASLDARQQARPDGGMVVGVWVGAAGAGERRSGAGRRGSRLPGRADGWRWVGEQLTEQLGESSIWIGRPECGPFSSAVNSVPTY